MNSLEVVEFKTCLNSVSFKPRGYTNPKKNNNNNVKHLNMYSQLSFRKVIFPVWVFILTEVSDLHFVFLLFISYLLMY